MLVAFSTYCRTAYCMLIVPYPYILPHSFNIPFRTPIPHIPSTHPFHTSLPHTLLPGVTGRLGTLFFSVNVVAFPALSAMDLLISDRQVRNVWTDR